jgi:hypothetical protein
MRAAANAAKAAAHYAVRGGGGRGVWGRGGGGGGRGAVHAASSKPDEHHLDASVRTALAKLDTIFGFLVNQTLTVEQSVAYLRGVHESLCEFYRGSGIPQVPASAQETPSPLPLPAGAGRSGASHAVPVGSPSLLSSGLALSPQLSNMDSIGGARYTPELYAVFERRMKKTGLTPLDVLFAR